jgi:hypothetical protein
MVSQTITRTLGCPERVAARSCRSVDAASPAGRDAPVVAVAFGHAPCSLASPLAGVSSWENVASNGADGGSKS